MNYNKHRLGQAVGTALAWFAIIYLFLRFLFWLLERKATAWIAATILLFLPALLGVVVFVAYFSELTGFGVSDDNLWAVTVVPAFVIALAVGIWATLNARKRFTPAAAKHSDEQTERIERLLIRKPVK